MAKVACRFLLRGKRAGVSHKRERVCPEAADLLRDKHVPMNVFSELRAVKPMRQIELAQAMIAMNRYTISYAKSLVAATPTHQLVEGRKSRKTGLSDDQISLMQRESENLDREFRLAQQSYSSDHLELVLAIGYIARLLDSAAIVRFLAQNEPAILTEFQRLAELRQAA